MLRSIPINLAKLPRSFLNMDKQKLLLGCGLMPTADEDLNAFIEKKCIPLFKILENDPKIKFSITFSGRLLEHIENKQHQVLGLIKKLIKRGQLEVLSSGFYNPLLSLIPDEDKLGQIEHYNNWLKKKYDQSPMGIALGDRDWDPRFPGIFNAVGLEFAILDAFYFDGSLDGYYLTEDNGHQLKVFSNHIHSFKKGGKENPKNDPVVYYDHTADQLEDLLALAQDPKNSLECSTFSAFLEENEPTGLIYLPTASVKEGYLKSILTQNLRLNDLHKRIIQVSNKIASFKRGKGLFGSNEKDAKLKQAQAALYRTQGGFNSQDLAKDHLRQNFFGGLIEAETLCDTYNHGDRPFCEIAVMDYNNDGKDEIILSNNLLNLFISPHKGGIVTEADYKPKHINLANTLLRSGLLTDHFLLLPQNADMSAGQEAGDFIDAPYTYMPRRKGSEAGVLLTKEGKVDGLGVRLEKYISIFSKQSIIQIEYLISNNDDQDMDLCFGIEFAFNLRKNENDPKAKIEGAPLNEETQTMRLTQVEQGLSLKLDLDKPALVWNFVVEAKAPLSEKTQVVLPYWRFKLLKDQAWRLKISLCIEE